MAKFGASVFVGDFLPPPFTRRTPAATPLGTSRGWRGSGVMQAGGGRLVDELDRDDAGAADVVAVVGGGRPDDEAVIDGLRNQTRGTMTKRTPTYPVHAIWGSAPGSCHVWCWIEWHFAHPLQSGGGRCRATIPRRPFPQWTRSGRPPPEPSVRLCSAMAARRCG